MILLVTPCPKPRMTRADKWKKRSSVLKFFAFRDAVRQELKRLFALQNNHYMDFKSIEIIFYIPIPKSWSKKKKALYDDQPHEQRPDLDNLVKAWNDCVLAEDSTVWRIHATKLWTSDPDGWISVQNI
tara:strand:- start:844 stop:1227 length:384 start_codon:yes stop_codon:yes gene_type:complete